MKRWIISFLISCSILILCFIPKIPATKIKNQASGIQKSIVTIKKKTVEERKIQEENKVRTPKKIVHKKTEPITAVEEKSTVLEDNNFFEGSSSESFDQENLFEQLSESSGEAKKNQQPEIDENKISVYKNYVLKKIGEKKKYPLSSRAKGETGSVKIKIHINNNGGLDECEILQDCEFEKLNDAALSAVKKSVPFKNLPEDLESLELIFIMDFSLD